MTKLFKFLVALACIVNISNAKESEAEKLCNMGIKKENPQKSILENQCGIAAKEYEKLEDYSKALSYYQKSLAINKKVLGREHTSTLESYYYVGSLYERMGKYPKALSYYKKVVKICEKVLGKEHTDTAAMYNNIGGLYYRMGEYPKALSYYQKSLSISKKILGKKHIATAEIYNNLGVLYESMGEYPQALSYQQKSLAIKEKVLGKKHTSTAENYNSIGVLYESMGEYPKALSYQQKSLAINKKVLGKKHTSTANNYNNIAVLHERMGEYPKALKYHQKSLAINEKVLGKKHTSTATSYSNIGLLYESMGEYPKALNYQQKSLAIKEKVLGKKHTLTATSYNNIAVLHERMGDYPKALSYQQKSLAINEKVLGKKHTLTATSYNNIGVLYESMGEYPKALSYCQKSLAINEKVLGEKHTSTAESYSNIGLLYKEVGEYPKAYNYAKKSFDTFLYNRDKSFVILDNKQKKFYLKKHNKRVPLLLDIAYLYLDNNSTVKKEVSQETFNRWLNYKGAIFDSENAISTLYQTTKDKKLKEKINDLISNKRVLAKLYQTLPKHEEVKRWKEKIKQTEEKIATLTTDIFSKVQSLKEQQGLKNITYKDIATNLKENELYIDYAKAGDHYYLFSLDNKENITFKRIDENNSKKIDSLVQTFREDIQYILDKSMSDKELKQLTLNSKEKLSKLYELVLKQPLSIELKEKQNLIISSDGALKLLPFEAMFDTKKNQYLIEQKEIRYIPSGKELVRLYKYGQHYSSNEARDTVIFSNPNFNTRASLDQEEIAVTPNTSRAGIIKSLFKMRFSSLPGTKAEAQEIKNTLIKEQITEYKEEQASEINLMKVKEPKILHIATHGFFINDKNIPNPMLKSGIALSGANTSAIKGKSEGIVTALKLSGLDLKGTDLVVLSACQTGVVDINDTESVSGLSKAFIQAGAKDIIMSLWSVDDEATKDLMASFYKQTITHKEYDTALKEAKLKMIKENRHPFYWAAFVLNGL